MLRAACCVLTILTVNCDLVWWFGVAVYGNGKAGYANGASDVACFRFPVGLCIQSTGSGSGSGRLICADEGNNVIRQINLLDDSVSTGPSPRSSAFRRPHSVCVDPLNPANGLYVGDDSAVLYYDGQKKMVSLIAGSTMYGAENGIGSAAMFCSVAGLICSEDGQTLYVSDCGACRLRSIDLKTRTVKTIAGQGVDGIGLDASLHYAFQLCFDRSVSVKPESVIWIATFIGLRRFDITTGTVPPLQCVTVICDLCITSTVDVVFLPLQVL